jgi:RyR domain
MSNSAGRGWPLPTWWTGNLIGFHTKRLNVLAEREHELWMDFLMQNGWTYSEKRDNSKRRHHLLVPFDKLPDKEKPKDHQAIRSYPKLAKLAGYKIVFLSAMPQTEDPIQS